MGFPERLSQYLLVFSSERADSEITDKQRFVRELPAKTATYRSLRSLQSAALVPSAGTVHFHKTAFGSWNAFGADVTASAFFTSAPSLAAKPPIAREHHAISIGDETCPLGRGRRSKSCRAPRIHLGWVGDHQRRQQARGATSRHSRRGNPHADLRGEIPAEQRLPCESHGLEKNLFDLGAGQFRGKRRMGNAPRRSFARLHSGQGMRRETRPGQKRRAVI